VCIITQSYSCTRHASSSAADPTFDLRRILRRANGTVLRVVAPQRTRCLRRLAWAALTRSDCGLTGLIADLIVSVGEAIPLFVRDTAELQAVLAEGRAR
jgi:hypothetical protein